MGGGVLLLRTDSVRHVRPTGHSGRIGALPVSALIGPAPPAAEPWCAPFGRGGLGGARRAHCAEPGRARLQERGRSDRLQRTHRAGTCGVSRTRRRRPHRQRNPVSALGRYSRGASPHTGGAAASALTLHTSDKRLHAHSPVSAVQRGGCRPSTASPAGPVNATCRCASTCPARPAPRSRTWCSRSAPPSPDWAGRSPHRPLARAVAAPGLQGELDYTGPAPWPGPGLLRRRCAGRCHPAQPARTASGAGAHDLTIRQQGPAISRPRPRSDRDPWRAASRRSRIHGQGSAAVRWVWSAGEVAVMRAAGSGRC